MRVDEMVYRSVADLKLLSNNPRTIKKADFQRLVDSIKSNGFWPHRPLALEEQDGVLVVLCGNQRLKAAKKLKLKEVPTVLYHDLTEEERADLILRDNINNGEFDYVALQLDDVWQDVDKEYIGIQIPVEEKEKAARKLNNSSLDRGNDDENEETDPENEEETEDDGKEEFFRSMFKDVLYASDNDFDIPTLLMEQMAGKLELPFSPWGANSRLRKDVTTYHFYVDDYRFEHLFKDPVKLLMSGCRAVVEPNCSCHDQTPIAWGIQLIYKKRWLARYFQECGIKVYADLNVAHKFIKYNKMGIPKGYNAFFTRGLDGWMESLESDLAVAQEISGLECPNLVVYGGGKEIKKFCQEHNLLYVSDFINAKKV